jgi:hypothetical protein
MSGVAHRLSQGGFEGFGAFFENRSDLVGDVCHDRFFSMSRGSNKPYGC